ncbi:MAG TPA: replicative DNA helicase [Actinomycetota bacterium]|nr:replicative DNA helicase [Actinomycetota bacterium]
MARAADEVRRLRPERVPPQNVEAEQSVLGSMMLSAEAIADVVEVLQPEDFYRAAHGKIFETLRGLYARGEPVDVVTAVEALKRAGILEEVGGPLYIRDLVDQVPTPAAAAHYARIVAQTALLRRLIRAAGDIMEMAYGAPEDPERVADEAEQRIYEVARRDDREEIVRIRDLVDQAMIDLEHIQNREAPYAGIPTGFRDLDTLLSGLQRGNLIVVAARPGVGKSSFVTNVARNIAVAGHPVALFSLEMSRWEIGMRLLCGEARVPWDRIRNKRVGADDWSRVVQAAEVLYDIPLSIVDSGNVTIVDIRAKARRMRTSKQGLDLIIVDYLQLMTHHRRVENRQQEIAEISRSLKLLAKELDIPVIAVSQLNRDPERRQDKRPQLSDLRECVVGDTLVWLADGRRVPIRELVGTRPDVLAMSPEGRIVTAKSDLVWEVGVRPTFRVTLASGRTIRATADHRLYGASGWVRIADLRVGDRVAVARCVPEPEDPIEWPDLQVALLGQMVGDGSYLNNAPMRYTTGSEENSRIVRTAAEELFGAKVVRYAGRGAWHQLLISGNGNRWQPRGVNAWLRELGIFGQRSHEKRLPREAFRLSNRQVALLLRHLWATDGSISTRKAGRGAHRIYFSTASPGLAWDVAGLLLRLGVVARVRRAHPGTGRPWFTVDVSGRDQQLRFLATVGGFGERAAAAATLRDAIVGRRSGSNVDTLPREVFEQVREAMVERGLTRQALATARGVTKVDLRSRFAPSRALIDEYAEALDDDGLRAWANSDLFWDRVVSVERLGDEVVFDMTVPGPASWLADGIVTHNSGAIEQDSDVVMFIHRDDLDPAKKGVADIIVAKHRNGPTGTVPLTFLPELTQFRNHFPGEQ